MLPPTDLLDEARIVAQCAQAEGVATRGVVAVIDYSLPSTAERLWVVDTRTNEVLLHTRVAHGQGTGDDVATAFSNKDGSHQSSLGVFRAGEVYEGKHGRSLRLDGLEPGVNDRARSRDIVIHAAEYATDAFVAEHGRLGRSWGCPAVDPAVLDRVIDLLQDGGLILAWYPEQSWLRTSRFLDCRV